ncbi:ribokinase [Ruminococcaceae bacterium OttesenSCG-928-D13]|nr:ribokinase [Ruminococcaceae bacterium OttesenSCG-928-D13]
MDILNFGSLNIDYVYTVDHIVGAGETIASRTLESFAGGKGLNQSIALARAGASVHHAGMVGADGEDLVDLLAENGVDVSSIQRVETRTGHAIIQLAAGGQNSIVLYGGANRCLSKAYIDDTLSRFDENTMVLLQNETNLCDYIIEQAHQRGMRVAMNPAPYDEAVARCDLSKVSVLILNEVEGAQISGGQAPDEVLDTLRARYPDTMIMLTLGRDGAVFSCRGETHRHGIYEVPVVDTTGAGDTFTGYFLAALLRDEPYGEAVRLASVASSLAVTEKGAANAIPTLARVRNAGLSPMNQSD